MTSTTPRTPINETPRDHHVCPWWIGYFLVSPLRKLGENPKKILGQWVEPGMTAVDIGSAMGFFSLPLARMVGENGRVVCLDIQNRMLDSLAKRARRKGLDHIIESRLATQEDLGLDDLAGLADLALAVHVVHETSYPRRFLSQCHEVLRPAGRLLLIEPRGHVSEKDFESTRHLAFDLGFDEIDHHLLRKSHVSILERPALNTGQGS